MTKNSHFLASLGLLALLILAVLGCGGGQKTHPVTGKVTFPDGTPLTKGEVVFEGAEYEARGQIKEDGTYELGSYEVDDGAPPGSYRVYLDGAAAGHSDDFEEGEDEPKPLVHPRFLSAETSKLECEVDGETTFDIAVEQP